MGPGGDAGFPGNSLGMGARLQWGSGSSHSLQSFWPKKPRGEKVMLRTGTWPPHHARGPEKPSRGPGPGQAAWAAPVDPSRRHSVSGPRTIPQSAEHVCDTATGQQPCVPVSPSTARPVSAAPPASPSPSRLPTCPQAQLCPSSSRGVSWRSVRTRSHSHTSVFPAQTRVLLQLLPAAGCPRGYREVQPGPGLPHAQLREDGPHPPGDRGPGPRRRQHHGRPGVFGAPLRRQLGVRGKGMRGVSSSRGPACGFTHTWAWVPGHSVAFDKLLPEPPYPYQGDHGACP